MPQLFMAILILGLGWYGLKFFARASPKMVARTVRYGAGGIAGIVSLLLILRGRIDIGIPGLGFAAWLAGLRLPGLPTFGKGAVLVCVAIIPWLPLLVLAIFVVAWLARRLLGFRRVGAHPST